MVYLIVTSILVQHNNTRYFIAFNSSVAHYAEIAIARHSNTIPRFHVATVEGEGFTKK